MDKSVIIKANKHGLTLNLDSDITYDDLREKIKEKFMESSKFFGNARMALYIEGRTMSSNEIDDIIDIISDVTELDILSVIDNSESNDKVFKKQLNKVFNELDANAAEIYPFNVEQHMTLEFKRSVIIMGNIEKNAEVHTDGSVFVLGTVEGSIYAGELGNTSAKIYAKLLNPRTICIADIPYKVNKVKETKSKIGLFRKDNSEAPKLCEVILSLSGDEICVESFFDKNAD